MPLGDAETGSCDFQVALEDDHFVKDAGTIQIHGAALQDAVPLPLLLYYFPTCSASQSSLISAFAPTLPSLLAECLYY